MARIRTRSAIHEAAASSTVDGNVVKGVVMLGPMSKNVGESGKAIAYTEAAMKAAIESKVYEGCHAYIDHEEEESARPMRALLGVFENVRCEEGKIKGDLVVSAREQWFCEDAKNPSLAKAFGFSHDAYIDTKEGESVEEVTSISAVNSVDLVSRPATTKGVFESMRKNKNPREIRAVKVTEAEVGDKVTCDRYGSPCVGEVLKKGAGILIQVGDSLVMKFEDEVMTVTVQGATEPPAEPAATEAPEADKEQPKGGEPSPSENPPAEEPMDTKMQERIAKLEVENSRLRLTEALTKFPAKAREAALKRLAGKVLTADEIEGEVKALEEFQSAFATAPTIDSDLVGARREGDSGKDGVEDASRLFEAFGALGGKSSGRERAVELAGKA